MGDIISYTPTTINDQLTTNREQKANLFALSRGAEEEKLHSGLNNQKAELLPDSAILKRVSRYSLSESVSVVSVRVIRVSARIKQLQSN